MLFGVIIRNIEETNKLQLELIDLTKQYGSFTALDHANILFTEGIYGILGENGAGKSTMMNLLTDNIHRTDGQILFNGTDILELGKDFRRVLGYMPQQQGFYDHMTAQTFLYYIADLKGLTKKEAVKEIDMLLDVTNLSPVRHKKLGGYSGGMKQRVLLAQALLGDPKVVILDEPTAGLDPKERVKFRKLISSFAEKKIVLLSTHIVSDVEYIADEIIILKKGRIENSGSITYLLKEIQNCVWECLVSEKDVNQIEQLYTVSNRKYGEDGVVLRIVSKEKPFIDAKQVVPTLEDLYLFYFREGE